MAKLQPLPGELTDTLVGSLVTVVRRVIVDGDIEAGGKINELAMAQQLGVSRSALRECVRLLEQSGLVIIEPNRGVFVRRVSLEEALDLFDIRAGLARTAGSLAALRAGQAELDRLGSLHEQLAGARRRADFDAYYETNLLFHSALFAATGNDRLATLEAMMSGELQLFRRRNLGNEAQLDASIAEHARILDAIQSRDPARAGRLFEKHVLTGKDRMLHTIGHTHHGAT